MTDAPMIEAHGLTKRFGPTVALAGIDLEVPAGAILGVLGPNGAGKTTAVRILTTLALPGSGSARVAGHDVVREPSAVQRNIGVTAQDATLDEVLTGRENLVMVGRLSGLRRAEARTRAGELLDQFDLTDAADRVLKGYSGGMRRRLDLAAGLVTRPPVLFLDEPTTGLDPRARNDMWDVIRDLVAGGTTLLLTTQYLDEADELADDIVVVDHGTIIAQGTADELKDRIGGDVVEFVVPDAAERSRALEAIRRLTDTEPSLADDGTISLRVGHRGSEVLIEVVRSLDVASISSHGLSVRRPSLDDVFLALTGHAAEETELEPAR
jgi:ABC-2 type transport system ATP-binding protein